jgi:hypothetical protein
MSKRKFAAIVLLILFGIFSSVSSIGFLIVSTRFNGPPLIHVPSYLRQVKLDDNLQNLHVSFSSPTGNFSSDFSEIIIYASLTRIATIRNPVFIKDGTWTLRTDEGNYTQDLFTTVIPIEESSLIHLGLDKNGLATNQTPVEMLILYIDSNGQLTSQTKFEFQNRTDLLP